MTPFTFGKIGTRVLVLSLLLPIFSCTTPSDSPTHGGNRTNNETPSLKLFWLSLDGLKKDDVAKYAKKLKQPHPKGFTYLLSQPNWNEKLKVNNPTITASSHISTMTCTTAGEHGIYSNSQWDGLRNVSGFKTAYPSETFVHALMASGLRVASLGYPGIDGGTRERSASLGFSYDEPKSKSFFVSLPLGGNQAITVKSRASEAKEAEVTIRAQADAKGEEVVYTLPNGRTVSQKKGNWANLIFVEGGVTQLVATLFLGVNDQTLRLYVTPVMINAAFPESFRAGLDRRQSVFSPGKDYALRTEAGDEAFLKSLEHRLAFFTSTAHDVLRLENPDVLFLYLEDLDVLGHQYYDDTQAEPLVERYFEKLDQELGRLFSKIPNSSEVVVVGDHGMATTRYEVNIRAVLPKDSLNNLQINTSGGALFLYGKDAPVVSQPPSEAAWFKSVVQTLQQARLPFDGDRLLFERVIVKGSPLAKEHGLEGPKMPWIVAFTPSGVGIKNSLEDVYFASLRPDFELKFPWKEELRVALNKGQPSKPMPSGNHGHFNGDFAMATSLLLMGPRLSKVPAMSVALNLDLVPLVADALHVKRPSGCPKN